MSTQSANSGQLADGQQAEVSLEPETNQGRGFHGFDVDLDAGRSPLLLQHLGTASQEVRSGPRKPRALILAPTRELATQIEDALTPLAAPLGLTSRTVFGGVGQNPQVQAIARGVDVVVACPGRLEDLIGQGHVSLDAVEITVLDEADANHLDVVSCA